MSITRCKTVWGAMLLGGVPALCFCAAIFLIFW